MASGLSGAEIKNKISESGINGVWDIASKTFDRTAESLRGATSAIQEQTQDQAGWLADIGSDFLKTLTQQIRNRPVTASVVALGLGAVLAMGCRRRG